MRAMTNRVLIDMVKNHRDTVMAIEAHWMTCWVQMNLGIRSTVVPKLTVTAVWCLEYKPCRDRVLE